MLVNPLYPGKPLNEYIFKQWRPRWNAFHQGLLCKGKKIFRQMNTIYFWKLWPDIPRYVQWTIPSILYQARRKNPLEYKGLIMKELPSIFCNLTCFYYMAFGPLSSHAPNWFLSPLALQETGTLHTTLRYSDGIVVCYTKTTSGQHFSSDEYLNIFTYYYCCFSPDHYNQIEHSW